MTAKPPGASRPAGLPPALDDPGLRSALRALPAEVDPRQLEALEQRVLAQWREQVARTGRVPAASSMSSGGGSAVLGGAGPWAGFDRLRWLGIALTIVGAVGALLWLQRPDPVLDELLKVDVLSQMAAGEM